MQGGQKAVIVSPIDEQKPREIGYRDILQQRNAPDLPGSSIKFEEIGF